ncbi:MAG: hypothetical protein HYV29_13105 [Ignavibacteriales bacterium]|nr:hypothetical protein [Ignavibacteriales bacterium]
MTTKTDVQKEIEKAFSFLNDLGYSCEYFDAGPKFGVNYKSTKLNRRIEIMLEAYEHGMMECSIRRNYPKYLPLLYRDTNKKVFIDINTSFNTDQELLAIISCMRFESKEEIIYKYAKYAQHKLYKIVSGEAWL